MKQFTRFFLLLSTLYFVVACANRGMGPQGGAVDKEPPRYIRSIPALNQIQFKQRKLTIEFDELIQLESQQEKVIVSPPQINLPQIRTNGRRVQIELNDSLKPNTTYVVDFADAIVDNNERNVLPNFVLAFSTGDFIDSLQISGKVLNAADLEPMPGVLVGVYTDLSDSAFVKKPFDRIAATDMHANFTIKNMAEGRYRLYGLKDIDRSSSYSLPNEEIAFYSEIIEPSSKRVERIDTLWKDSLTIDTIQTIVVTDFEPKNILIRTFAEKHTQVYLEKYDRPAQNKLTFTFSAPNKELPHLQPTNFEPSADWFLVERSATNDTLTYWLTDSTIFKQEELALKVSYLRSDSLKQLVSYTDSLIFHFTPPELPKRKPNAKRRKVEETPETETQHLKLSTNLSGTMDIYGAITFSTEVPYLAFPDSAVRMEQIIDTVQTKPIPITLLRDSLNPRAFSFVHKWEPGKEYRVSIDSAAIAGINHLTINKFAQLFKIRPFEDYGSIFINFQGVQDSAVAVMLNSSDKPVRFEPVKKGTAEFFYLKPDKYYLRLFIDRNGNGLWDTGDLLKGIQPEEVFYYPGMFELRANWDIEQDWDPRVLPLDKQKPLEITKNKPKEVTPQHEQGY